MRIVKPLAMSRIHCSGLSCTGIIRTGNTDSFELLLRHVEPSPVVALNMRYSPSEPKAGVRSTKEVTAEKTRLANKLQKVLSLAERGDGPLPGAVPKRPQPGAANPRISLSYWYAAAGLLSMLGSGSPCGGTVVISIVPHVTSLEPPTPAPTTRPASAAVRSRVASARPRSPTHPGRTSTEGSAAGGSTPREFTGVGDCSP